MKKVLILFFTSFLVYSQNPADLDLTVYSNPSYVKLLGFSGSTNDIAKQADGKIIVAGGFASYNGVSKTAILRLNSDGSLDSTFNCLGLLNNINTVAIQTDGKIIVGGTFINFSSTSSNRIVRLNADGTRDTSFIVGSGFNEEVTKILLQTDGKLIVSGNFTQYKGINANRIIRLNADGSIDTSFSTGTGLNSPAKTIIQQQDGKLLIGGSFNTYNGTTKLRLLKLNTDGSIDSTFNSSGTGFNSNYITDINNVLELSSGKIIVSGKNLVQYNNTLVKEIIRLNSDGSLDSTFDTGLGFTNISCTSTNEAIINDVKELSNGKLLVSGGDFNAYNNTSASALIRLNADGTTDNTYTNIFAAIRCNGSKKIIVDQNEDVFLLVSGIDPENYFKLGLIKILNTGFLDHSFNPGRGFTDKANKIILQQDGKVVIAGDFDRYNDVKIDRLIRLDQQGNVDFSFSIGSGFNNIIRDILIQTDNKIIVTGDFTSFNGTTVSGLVRLNPNGSIDLTFNTGSGFNGIANKVYQQNDGKLILFGNFTTFNGVAANRIVRLNLDGSLDQTFSTGIGFGSGTVSSIYIQLDGTFLVGGVFTSFNGVTCKKFLKLNSNGTLDTSFSTGELFATDYNIVNIKQQSTGKIIIAKYNINGYVLLRLNTNGTSDSTFSNSTINYSSQIPEFKIQPDDSILLGGNLIINNVNTGDLVKLSSNGSLTNQYSPGWTSDFVILPDNKIIVVGLFSSNTSSPSNRIAKFNTDYTFDSTFNNTPGFNNSVNAINLQQNGKLVIGGNFTTFNGNLSKKIIRLNENATQDYTFSTGVGFDDNVYSIAKTANNKLIIGGNFSSYNNYSSSKLIQLNEDGSVDTSFNIGLGFNGKVNSISVQSDGKIIVAGDFTAYNTINKNYIIRLNFDGSIDNSFNINQGANNFINCTLIESDGKIIIGGAFTSFNSNTTNRIARLNSNGSIDTTFQTGLGFDNTVNSIAKTLSNKIIIGGNFTSYNNSSANRILKLNEDGSFDTSFSIGTGFNEEVKTVSTDQNERILVGGIFTSINGIARNRIARLNNNGTNDSIFEPNAGFDSTVNTINILPNQKILVGGDFTLYRTTASNRFVRLIGDNNNLATNEATPSFDEYKVIIYPNPVKNTLYFIIDNNQLQDIEIHDMNGKKMLKPLINSNSINVEFLEKGIYFITFKYPKNNLVKKFIKE